MSNTISVLRIPVTLVTLMLLMVIAASVAADQTRLYEVQVDVYENNELILAPSAVVEEGKTARIIIGSKVMELTVNSEGMMDGMPVVSLALNVQALAATSVDGDLSEIQSEMESSPITAPTLYFDDTSQPKDPATVSVGTIDVSASVRRVEASKIAELLESAASTIECSTDGGSVNGGDATIGDGSDNCCSKSCTDGSGNTMTCCGAVMCCACGVCCSP